MTQFKGIKQVTLAFYNGMSDEEKRGYLFLVRDGVYKDDGLTIEGEPTSEEIYFGKRKYADTSHRFISNIFEAFGGLLDSEGSFILPIEKDFVSFDDSKAENLSDILYALDAAIKANDDKFTQYYTKTEVNEIKTTIEVAIAACVKGVSIKVGDSTYDGTISDGVATVDLSEAFGAAGKVKDVKVGGTSVVNEDGIANITIPEVEVPFKTVAVGDKVLALNEGVLSSTLSYVREEVRGVDSLVLKGIDGAIIGSVPIADFVADGMLESVEDLENGKFRFTFNTDKDGVEGKDYFDVDFSRFIDTYQADGTSIELKSGNTFSVKEVESEKVSVGQIPVGGTPLAQILLDNNINSINSGNLQEVLEALFSQNNWAENPRRNIPTSLSVSMSSPDLSFDKSGTVEVGTTVNVTATAKTATASASITYDGFDYGYSLENDNTKDGEIPSSVSINGTKDADSNYKLSFVTNNGFGSKDIANVDGSTLTATPMVVADGTNKITVTASSPTFTAIVPAQAKIYACSSLNKTDEEHVVDASEESTISGSVKTSTYNKSITGAYYAFVGFSDTLPKTNDEYRAFIGNNYSRLGKGSVTSGTCDKTYMAVCIPSGWDFTCNTSLGADMRGSFTETGDVTITLPDNTTKAYKYYALTYKDGAFKDLVIK